MSALCLLNLARLYNITKNTSKRVSTVIDYMARQDQRLEELENSHKTMLAHFVSMKQKKKTAFPFRDKNAVLAYAEAGDFEDLIKL